MNDFKKAVKKTYRKPRIVHEEKIEARAGGCGKSTATSTACTGTGFNS
jgi:hypothetical protein